jgi:hypothetical protein
MTATAACCWCRPGHTGSGSPWSISIRIRWVECHPNVRLTFSVALTDGIPARLTYADVMEAPPRSSAGALTGTDSALIALYDDAVPDITPDRLVDALNATQPLPQGYANLPLAGGANVVASHSGFGDGAFPILATFTETGVPVAIHIDFGVVARSDDDEDE